MAKVSSCISPPLSSRVSLVSTSPQMVILLASSVSSLISIGYAVTGLPRIALGFSFAAFCAMFTGHILALPAFYGILNGLVITVYFLVTSLMDLFFFGYSGMQAETPLVRYLTPVYALEEACRWPTVYSDSGEAVSRGLESPGTVAAYAAAGVVLAVLALLVYQRRHV